jgi:dTDP-4-dehydrorhamnose reductase
MRILILGGTGMIGHGLWSELSRTNEVWATMRGEASRLPEIPYINRRNIIENQSIDDLVTLRKRIHELKPGVVINCIGITKHMKESENAILTIKTNALFPYDLSILCRECQASMIQISTDCVFDGKKGNYSENDSPNAKDLYGRTKAISEIANESHVLTVRTSTIGFELFQPTNLLGWFISQNGKKAKGFKDAIYSGVTTRYLAHILDRFVLSRDFIPGLFNISGPVIDKYSLLKLIKKQLNLNIEIEPETITRIDRSLDSARFRELTGFYPASWEEMIANYLK